MKKIVLLLFVAALLAAPLISVMAEDATDPAKTENLQSEKVPDAKPESATPDIFQSIINGVENLGKVLPTVGIAAILIIATWTFFDASRRTRIGWVWGISSLLIIPWIIYLVSRPIYTLEEQKLIEADEELRRIQKDYYQYALSKEKHICTVCGTPVQPDYKVCPNCYTELKKACTRCGKPLDPDWKVCPYCGNR